MEIVSQGENFTDSGWPEMQIILPTINCQRRKTV